VFASELAQQSTKLIVHGSYAAAATTTTTTTTPV